MCPGINFCCLKYKISCHLSKIFGFGYRSDLSDYFDNHRRHEELNEPIVIQTKHLSKCSLVISHLKAQANDFNILSIFLNDVELC